jgi:hypothetical protein
LAVSYLQNGRIKGWRWKREDKAGFQQAFLDFGDQIGPSRSANTACATDPAGPIDICAISWYWAAVSQF